MKKITTVLGGLVIILIVSFFMMGASSFTPSLQLENPTPGDQATRDTWGIKENNSRILLDNAVAGILTLNLPTQPNYPNVVLTSTSGAPDQARNRLFIFTGNLTQTTTVYFPPGLPRFFAVLNNTTGSNLVVAVGAGGAANGATVTVTPSSFPLQLYSDGTNINSEAATPSGGVQPTGTAGGDLSGNFPNPTVVSTHLTSLLPSAQGGVPTGTMFYYTGVGAPAGYLVGDGSAQSRANFPALNALYAAAGYPYGVGDGSTTFNIIDCRARYIAGGDAGNATGRLTGNTAQGVSAATLGNVGGEQAHTQTLAELFNHNHASPALHDPGHSHTTNQAGFFGSGSTGFTTFQSGVNFGAPSTGTSTTGITLDANTGNTGGGSAFNLIPPTIVANCVIKTEAAPLTDGTALAANDYRDVWRWRWDAVA